MYWKGDHHQVLRAIGILILSMVLYHVLRATADKDTHHSVFLEEDFCIIEAKSGKKTEISAIYSLTNSFDLDLVWGEVIVVQSSFSRMSMS